MDYMDFQTVAGVVAVSGFFICLASALGIGMAQKIDAQSGRPPGKFAGWIPNILFLVGVVILVVGLYMAGTHPPHLG